MMIPKMRLRRVRVEIRMVESIKFTKQPFFFQSPKELHQSSTFLSKQKKTLTPAMISCEIGERFYRRIIRKEYLFFIPIFWGKEVSS